MAAQLTTWPWVSPKGTQNLDSTPYPFRVHKSNTTANLMWESLRTFPIFSIIETLTGGLTGFKERILKSVDTNAKLDFSMIASTSTLQAMKSDSWLAAYWLTSVLSFFLNSCSVEL